MTSSTNFIIGIAIIGLLYIIWLSLAGIGLRGVTLGENISSIRQQAGLSLLLILILSVVIFAFFRFLEPAAVPAPLPI